MNRATEADLCIATADTPTDRLPQLAEAARREGATLCIMEPMPTSNAATVAGVWRRNTPRRRSTTGVICCFQRNIAETTFQTMTKVYTKTGETKGERRRSSAASACRRSTSGSKPTERWDELGSFTAHLSDHLRSDEGLAEYLGDPRPRRIATDERRRTAGRRARRRRETARHKSRGDRVSGRAHRRDAVPRAADHQIHDSRRPSNCLACATSAARSAAARTRQPARSSTSPPRSSANTLAYLNRLSDYFYLLGRALTEYYKVEETLWRR